MGLIICDKHGETGFMPFISNELSKKVLDNEILCKEDITYVDISLVDEDDGEEMHSMRYWMSTSCFDGLGAERKYIIKSDEDETRLDEIFNPIMKGGGLCGKCFTDYINNVKA